MMNQPKNCSSTGRELFHDNQENELTESPETSASSQLTAKELLLATEGLARTIKVNFIFSE